MKIFKNKKILILVIVIIIIIAAFLISKYLHHNENGPEANENREAEEENKTDKINGTTKNDLNDFIECLADSGMVVYGTRTCPACAAFVNSFGGYDKVTSLYVECHEEGERCQTEMQTNYVPEIQIKGELYEGPRDHHSLSQATGCPLP